MRIKVLPEILQDVYKRQHGKSLAGIALYSKYPVTSGVRKSFPISTSFSKFLDLDRCYSISRIPVENGKELVIFAQHMSAYGNSDAIREAQISKLCGDMQAEYEKGNYEMCIRDRYGRLLQQKVRNGDSQCILPLVAYYGTGRLWLQKRNRNPYYPGEKLNRQMGYIDCLAAESNEKQMTQWFEKMTYIQLQEGRPIPELEAVKNAMKRCYLSVDSSIKNVQFAFDVKSGELEGLIYRDDQTDKFPVRMLSDGEKGIISLVADIAYRMALLNPDLLDRVLETPGVVLILSLIHI